MANSVNWNIYKILGEWNSHKAKFSCIAPGAKFTVFKRHEIQL